MTARKDAPKILWEAVIKLGYAGSLGSSGL